MNEYGKPYSEILYSLCETVHITKSKPTRPDSIDPDTNRPNPTDTIRINRRDLVEQTDLTDWTASTRPIDRLYRTEIDAVDWTTQPTDSTEGDQPT